MVIAARLGALPRWAAMPRHSAEVGGDAHRGPGNDVVHPARDGQGASAGGRSASRSSLACRAP